MEAPVVPAEDVPFCVTPDKYASYKSIFANQSEAVNGFISAMEARAVFLQSGLPNATLAQVWNLADSTQKGNLTESEFVLSMHLLAAVLQGWDQKIRYFVRSLFGRNIYWKVVFSSKSDLVCI